MHTDSRRNFEHVGVHYLFELLLSGTVMRFKISIGDIYTLLKTIRKRQVLRIVVAKKMNQLDHKRFIHTCFFILSTALLAS